jgi:hypothetical protein
MQQHINHEEVVITPLIYYSDQTTLSKDARVVEYPIYMSIGNIACEDCNLDEGHILLVILPTPSKNKGTHLRKLKMFHEFLEVLLNPFKEGSFKNMLYYVFNFK